MYNYAFNRKIPFKWTIRNCFKIFKKKIFYYNLYMYIEMYTEKYENASMVKQKKK